MFSLKRKTSLKTKGGLKTARSNTRQLARQKPLPKKPGEKAQAQAGKALGRYALKASLPVLIFSLVSLGLLAGYVGLAGSAGFKVRRVEVEGLRHLSKFEVLSAAAVGADSSLITMSIFKMEKQLNELGWVKSASVQRKPPRAVKISIIEHEPKHLAMTEKGLIHLDDQLRPIVPATGDDLGDMPVITGLSSKEIAKPDAEIKALLLAAGDLLESLPDSWLGANGSLSEIHLDRVWGVSLVWSDIPPTVRLGFKGLERKLARMVGVVEDLKTRGELGRAVIIDMQSDRRVVVRLAGETA